MSNQVKNILKEATVVLDKLENGKTYPSSYIVGRFEKAAGKYPTDHLIGGMRDVLVKVAQKQDCISQKEIGNLYDKMYGFSGGQTGFRNLLGDLLPSTRQFEKVAYPGAKNRTMEERGVAPLYKDSELSDAFSVLFSMGGDSSFSTFKPSQDKSLQKAVISKLSSLGHTPEGVDVVHFNDHFALCSANYRTSKFNKVSTLIPVQITNGITKEPSLIILGGQAVDLDSRNLYTAIKEAERDGKSRSVSKFAGERGDDFSELKVKKAVVPNSLKEFTNLENSLIAAASKFSTSEINMAIAMLDGELTGLGVKNPEIKIGSSSPKGIVFDVNVSTKLGKSSIKIPVEIHNGIVALPSKFAANASTKEEVVFDFSKSGFERFANSIQSLPQSLKIARDSGPLGSMSYHQLIDRMVDGVANKDYKLAEDALDTIEKRFGGNQYLTAFDQFTQLLKHSAEGTVRQKLVKEAFERGDLIKIPTSVELYSPKLGLPLSKIAFDEKGKPIPAGRRAKSENQLQDTMMSTNKIILT